MNIARTLATPLPTGAIAMTDEFDFGTLADTERGMTHDAD